jgi:hypothetical protein
VRGAITSRSVFASSQSFGVVAMVLLLVLILERELLAVLRAPRGPKTVLSAIAVPLLAVFVLTTLVRIGSLLY